MTGHLLAAGAKPVTGNNSTILTGSPTLWTGVQPTGGTAYIFRASFTPLESGVGIPFYLFPGHFMTPSGSTASAFVLFSEPYSAA
jgi:hypothetical protein